MKIELYTKDDQGKCEVVGEVFTPGYPLVGATITSEKGIKYLIVEWAVEYDRHKNFVSCSAQVKTI
jgi:hypothetical protein